MTLMRKLCPGTRGTFPCGDGAVSVDVDVGSGGAVATGVEGSIAVGVGLSVGGAVAMVGCPVPAGVASGVDGTVAGGVPVGVGGVIAGGVAAGEGCTPGPAGIASGVDGAVAGGVPVGVGAGVVPEPQAVRKRNNVNAAASTRSPFGFLRPTLIASELHRRLRDWQPSHIYRRWEAQKSSRH